MDTTRRPTLVKVEDHEGDGTCLSCGREGLRWVVTLSDDSRVGLECAKKVMGWKPGPRSYAWTAHYRPIAQHTDYDQNFVLWQHRQGTRTVISVNGSLWQIGEGLARWKKEGFGGL